MPGDARQCFRIRTHSNLHVSMKCDHAKKLSLTCDLLAGGEADSPCSYLNKAKHSEAMTLSCQIVPRVRRPYGKGK